MRQVRMIAFYTCIIVHVFSCVEEKVQPYPTSYSNHFTHSYTSIAGTWIYSFPFYSSELIISDKGFFKFHDQGCTGHGYSEGSWTMEDGELILTSFDKFKKQIEPISISVQTTPPNPKTIMRKTSRGQYELKLADWIGNRTVSIKWPDTSNVYFDRLSHKLRGDTLYQLDQPHIFTGTKFHRVKNNGF